MSLRRAFDVATGDIFPEHYGGAVANNISPGVGFNAYLSDDAVTDEHNALVFDSENFDFGGFYDAVNGIWTPPQGLVILTASLQFGRSGNPSIRHVSIQKNGGNPRTDGHAFVPGTDFNDTAGACAQVTWIDYANGTDYYQVFAAPSSVTLIGGQSGGSYWSGACLTRGRHE